MNDQQLSTRPSNNPQFSLKSANLNGKLQNLAFNSALVISVQNVG